jgi:hypothetical protein
MFLQGGEEGNNGSSTLPRGRTGELTQTVDALKRAPFGFSKTFLEKGRMLVLLHKIPLHLILLSPMASTQELAPDGLKRQYERQQYILRVSYI